MCKCKVRGIIAGLISLLTMAIMGSIAWQYFDCVSTGGTFVRTLFWFTCLP
jgi:hypothetical protein